MPFCILEKELCVVVYEILTASTSEPYNYEVIINSESNPFGYVYYAVVAYDIILSTISYLQVRVNQNPLVM